MTDVTAKNINLLGIRAHAYHARARKHTLTSKHPSNCWTQRASHRNHLISESTHCISIDFSKKSAVSCPFLPLWGNIPLYTSRGCATKANFDRALVYVPTVSMPGIICLYEKRNGDAAKQVLQHLRINSGL